MLHMSYSQQKISKREPEPTHEQVYAYVGSFFYAISDHARKALETEKIELQRSTELQLNRQKDIATEVTKY